MIHHSQDYVCKRVSYSFVLYVATFPLFPLSFNCFGHVHSLSVNVACGGVRWRVPLSDSEAFV